MRAGCAMAFSNEAVSFCFFVKSSAFVVPILHLYIAILRYSSKDVAQDSTKDAKQDSTKDAKQDSAKDAKQDSAKDAKQDSAKKFCNKKRLPKKPFSVPRVGIEPTCPKTHDFESCASTNSAI